MTQGRGIDRRALIAGAAALSIAGTAAAAPRARDWRFDNLRKIGGRGVAVTGSPKLISGPVGRALQFDGIDDAIFIDEHPLAGARTFTLEALFRPDGGAFEQRWFHLESAEQPPVAAGRGSTRILFEIRVVGDLWYLDAFMTGNGYRQALMVPEKTFPLRRWYHVAQSYDGRTYRSFVNGELQQEVAMPFAPQGPGRSSVGVRMNQVNHFRGAIAHARFTHAALPASQFSLRRFQS